jgi:cytoskeletal protein CcmA (bactofilin family)
MTLTMLEVIPKLPPEANEKTYKRPGGLGPSLLVAKKPAVLSHSFDFEGHIREGGSLSIEGRFKGSICCDQVHIAHKAEVDAAIECKQLVVKGVFKGSAKCKELIVNSTATVDAHIEYEVMSIGSGAVMGGSLTARAPAPAVAE